MPTLKDITIDAIKHLQTYDLNHVKYITVKDLLTVKSYSKGCNNSVSTLIKRKGFDFQSVLFGAIDNNTLIVHEKYSRKWSKYFVKLSEVMKEFEDNREYDIKEAPAIIDDNGFSFFKDANGVQYKVEMRGERTKEGIFFKAKDIQSLFEMPSLCKNIKDKTNSFVENVDFRIFICKDSCAAEQVYNKELFITYKGLKKIINNATIGRAKEFSDWIDDIVFASVCGTKEQRIEVSSKILDIDAKCLQSFMNKSASDISCLYLIDIKRSVEGKTVYKYGFTKNLKRRFREHVSKYGDNITLETFCLIPQKNLADAETELKNCISDYIQNHEEFSTDEELIFLCREAQKNIKYIFNNISYRYCGDLDSIKLQYESIIKEKEHELNLMKLKYELELSKRDTRIIELSKDNENKDSKIELLELKLKLNSSPEHN